MYWGAISTILLNGNVGIGTLTPNTTSSKLDVHGCININPNSTNTPQIGIYGGSGVIE